MLVFTRVCLKGMMQRIYYNKHLCKENRRMNPTFGLLVWTILCTAALLIIIRFVYLYLKGSKEILD